MIWLRLGILALISGVMTLALTQTAAAPPPPLEVPTQPPATRVPLPTVPPQLITSRIARETPIPRPTSTPRALPQIDLVDNGYLPAQLLVQPGTTIVWTNS